MSKISFVIPAFNAEQTLARCLNSILKQNYQNEIEIIIVNDGSTDETLNIAKSYQQKNNNIKIIEQENRGVSMARNIAIKEAKSDYIVLVDSDDTLSEKLVETLFPYLKIGIDCIKFNAVFVGGDFEPSDKRFFAPAFSAKRGDEALMIFAKDEKIFATPWMYAIKRDIYVKNNLFFSVGRYHEDIGLIPLLIAKSKTVTSLNYIGYNYVQNSSSITNDISYEKEVIFAYDFLFHYRRLHREMDKMDMKEECRKFYYSYLSNKLLKKVKHLHGKDRENFVLKLKKEKVDDWIIVENQNHEK